MKINEITVGEKVVLTNTDTCETCVAILKSGCAASGCDHDLGMIYVGSTDDTDTDGLPIVVTDFAEADAAQISL